MNFRLPRNLSVYFLHLLLLCAALPLLSPHNAFAQAGQTEVTGTVTDEGDANVAGATVMSCPRFMIQLEPQSRSSVFARQRTPLVFDN